MMRRRFWFGMALALWATLAWPMGNAFAQKGAKLSAPTNVTATAGVNAVTLAWTAVSGATGYRVKRTLTSGKGYATVASPTSPGYTDTGLTAGTRYYYVVTAVSGSSESAKSAEVWAVPLGIPPAPTGLSAVSVPGGVRLTWNLSTGADAYRVKRADGASAPFVVLATSAPLVFVDGSATPGASFRYVVSAVNVYGEGANSAEVSAAAGERLPDSVPAIVYRSAATNATMVMNDDATGSNRRVVLPRGSWGEASFSADGGTLVFNDRMVLGSRYVSGLYAVGVDGTNLRLITPFFNIDNDTYDGGYGGYAYLSSSWSPAPAPDGREWIAYVDHCYQPEGYSGLGDDIYLVRPDGTGRMRLGVWGGHHGVTWSPDATRIATASWPLVVDGQIIDNTLSIYTLRHNEVTDLPEVGSARHYPMDSLLGGTGWEITAPWWSPSGNKIVFRAYNSPQNLTDVYTVDLSDPDHPVVVNVTNTPSERENSPSWSPDGSQIFYYRFSSGPNQGTAGIMRKNADGTGAATLVNDDGQAPKRRRF